VGSLPVLKPRQVVARLEALGFAEVRRRGSHKQFRHLDGRTTTVPFHAAREHLARAVAQDRRRHPPDRRRVPCGAVIAPPDKRIRLSRHSADVDIRNRRARSLSALRSAEQEVDRDEGDMR
jgi:predicted RNA binding protein YcfA (HicA-like mRNA interferase family)